jgi:glycosyltransferase involved in cell wall biosynthesis
VALYSGKLMPHKSLQTLIAAFGQADVPGSALVLVGDGDERARLEAQAATHDGARIVFTGFVDQEGMAAAYAMCDLLVLPSAREAWGLAVNEAMNMARAVCVSDQVGCAPDLVASDNGWVFPVGDVGALSAILREALGDRERLARMGEVSRARIADWDLDATVDGILHGVTTVTS